MAKKKNGGLINRIMLGAEKSEDYARNSLPSNRWELFWDIFKGRFGKLVIINLLVLLFCIPLVALILFRYVALINYGATYPFSTCFGVGYMASFNVVGYAESIVMQVNMVTYLLMPLAVMFMAIGIAGGAYVMRNMVWTEGVFVTNDFWRGIKTNFKQMLLIGLCFSLVFYVTVLAISFCQQNIAVGSSLKWLFIIMEILSYVILVGFSIMTLHMVTMCVTYNVKFKQLLKNSLMLTVTLAPFNLFFVVMGLIPFILLMLGGFFLIIGIIMCLLLGVSLMLLVWTDYSQWIYDKFINDKVPGAKKNRGIYEKVQSNEAKSISKYKQQLELAKGIYGNRPIKPITDDLELAELPTNFSRKDLERLSESKKAIYEDHRLYVEAHKNDPEFMPSEAELEMQKQQSEREKRIEKAKKELAKRNKKRR